MKRLFCAILTLALLCLTASADTAQPGLTLTAPKETAAASSKTLASANTQALDSEEAIANAALAADTIFDTTLTTGDIFSFNDIVGPRTESRGYVAAENGRGGRVTGGGAAAAASAIYLAVKDLEEISVVELSTYGSKYTGSYVESRSDAVLVDYKSGRDFRFKYTGEGTITIDMWVEDGRVYCAIVQED